MTSSSRPRRRIVAGIATAAVLVAIGAAANAQSGGGNDGGDAPAPRVGGAEALSPAETGFVPITPCRIVNTQNSAGRIGVGETRSYRMHGNTAAQGGAAACGISPEATALEMTVTAALPVGTGYLRVFPQAGVEPNATFLNFSGPNISNTGTVRVTPGAGSNFRVKAYGSAVHVIVDVAGYYVDPMVAVVSASGSLVRGTTGTSALKQSTGSYRVTFTRNVQGCTLTAALGSTAGGFPPTAGTAMAGFSDTAIQTDVYIETRNGAGASTDLPFHLTVTC